MVSEVRRPRGNDLLGFNWMIEASPIASWPSMFGYSTLLLVAAGFRGLRDQKGWIGAAALFWVLSLGSELHDRRREDRHPPALRRAQGGADPRDAADVEPFPDRDPAGPGRAVRRRVEEIWPGAWEHRACAWPSPRRPAQ